MRNDNVFLSTLAGWCWLWWMMSLLLIRGNAGLLFVGCCRLLCFVSIPQCFGTLVNAADSYLFSLICALSCGKHDISCAIDVLIGFTGLEKMKSQDSGMPWVYQLKPKNEVEIDNRVPYPIAFQWVTAVGVELRPYISTAVYNSRKRKPLRVTRCLNNAAVWLPATSVQTTQRAQFLLAQSGGWGAILGILHDLFHVLQCVNSNRSIGLYSQLHQLSVR